MKGNSPLFIKKESIATASTNFMGNDRKGLFAVYIANRKDRDPSGTLDIIAHGDAKAIEIFNKGKYQRISPREAAKLIKKDPAFKKAKYVRLFSCNTGSIENGFAQNLANALGKKVLAPNDIISTYISGKYWIGKDKSNVKFNEFIPGGYRKWKR